MKKRYLALAYLFITVLGPRGALAQSAPCAKVDEAQESKDVLNAALDKEKADASDLVSSQTKGLKWWVSKEGTVCPTEVTVQAKLAFAINHKSSICSFESDVTKVAFRGGDGTLPRFVINNRLQSCTLAPVK